MATPPPVIIVGSGLAGLSAASTLISRNIPVTMLDRSPKPGGNSIKASSGINSAGTRFQANDDSPDIFFQDTLKSAGDALTQASGNERARREKLISTLVQRSADAVDWLVDEKGVELSRVVQLGGHSYPRTHRGAGRGPPGLSIVGALLEGLKGGELFTLRCGARVTRVVKEGECVRGVEYVTVDGGDERQGKAKTQTETHTLNGPVIFATGGFAGDSRGMLATYRPDLANLPSTNEAREGTQPILEAVGASVVDMDCVQVHPTGLVDSKDPAALVKILAAEMLRGEGGILLDSDGSRFVNELDTRQHVVDAIVKSTCRMETSTCQWDVTLVLDESAAAAAGSHMDFYVAKGLMQKMTVDELGLAALKTLQEYADVVSGRKKDPFGRKSFGHWKLTEVMPEYEVYAGRVTPVIHFTMGGVVIDEQSMVLGAKGAPIEGLWAAGEVTGGIHGQNRLGGSSLLECVVFGRIAGNEAAAWHKEYHSGSPFP